LLPVWRILLGRRLPISLCAVLLGGRPRWRRAISSLLWRLPVWLRRGWLPVSLLCTVWLGRRRGPIWLGRWRAVGLLGRRSTVLLRRRRAVLMGRRRLLVVASLRRGFWFGQPWRPQFRNGLCHYSRP
jgi:hypothetical protein